VIDTIMSAADEFPARFVRSGDQLTLEAAIGQRKLFFSRRTLAYRCRLRVDDVAQRITFFEGLAERGPGLDDTLEPLTGPAVRRVKRATGVAARPPASQGHRVPLPAATTLASATGGCARRSSAPRRSPATK
jgi:hypothetical protein